MTDQSKKQEGGSDIMEGGEQKKKTMKKKTKVAPSGQRNKLKRLHTSVTDL